MKRKKTRKYTFYLGITVLLLVITMGMGVFAFRVYINYFTQETDPNRYEKYYMMIAEDNSSSFWQTVHKGAYEEGLKQNSYVDLLNDTFEGNYSREDMMRIAIASEVDGIIVAADESAVMTELINEASEKIPVVTLYEDNTRSSRCTFVGIGSYDLGREYGRQVLEIVKERQLPRAQVQVAPLYGENGERLMWTEKMVRPPVKVMVLVNAHTQNSGQNILCSGIQETIENEKEEELEVELSLVSIDDTNTFSVEESIRDIFMEADLPDIIVCLNELNTTCVYQAAVDYNKVGQVNILGYYDSDTILKAIDRNVIYATIAIDAEQMGRYCIDALTEYNAFGNTSQYFIADIELINKENVAEYMSGGGAADE
ncbi:MAG: substrate-binding domain-containing protein [Blautia sp.]|nr:substrate-binding domain-containing protein [Blautia sp.]MCM1201332.1 substrate-binding domain-containing protein [Bacteroides fragilis]